MNLKPVVLVLFPLVMAVGCSSPKYHATSPNGDSPARAKARHAQMDDSDASRKAWNHGNGVLWVNLPANGVVVPDDLNDAGAMRVKFAWWRGVPGNFTVTGHRIDGKAPSLGSKINVYQPYGLTPSYLYFPTPGYWEITGQIAGRPPLTFVVYCQKYKEQ
ncbi:MAG TPA: hypothetical protein VN625_01025 [Desulfuromonadaceae bacterium]|nr:hypothetical protein [Desulfuromonadaceae bacterium]